MKHSSLAKLVWTGCWLILACGLDGNVAARQAGNSLPQTTATSERRVALVIGNSDYGKQRLATTRHDAREVAAALREIGFEVTLGENVTQAEFRQLLSKFGGQTHKEGVGLFYFAGLGAQFNGSNWLIPTRAKFKSTAQLKTTAIAVEEVQTALTARSNLLLLDAARVIPLLRTKLPGLATLSAPADTLIAFSTQPGTTTLDPKGQAHSPYTASLLQHLRTPGMSLTTLFDRVRAEVASATKKRQTPWEASGLRGEFSLHPTSKTVAIVTAPENNELAAWQAIARSIHPADFQAYLAKYPQGIYTDSARVKLQQLAGKEEPKTSDVEPVSIPGSPVEVISKPPQISSFNSEAKQKTEPIPEAPATLPRNLLVTPETQTKVERLFYDACYVQKNTSACCQLAADLLGKFPTTTYRLEALKRTKECPLTTAWESFRAALNAYYAAPDSAKLEKLYATGEAFLSVRPAYPYVVAQMALAGSSAALSEIYQNRERVKGYAERALAIFFAASPPSLAMMSQQEWEKWRDIVLGNEHQYLGWYYLQKGTAEAEEIALRYLARAIEVKAQGNIGWRDPNNYWLRSTVYNNEHVRLSKQYTALSAEQKESDTGKALLAQINQVVDKLIVEYARVIAVADQPQYKPLRDAARESIQSLWKYRHGSLTGMEELIKRYEKDPSIA